MPASEAPHPRGPGNPCNVCWEIIWDNDAPLFGHDLGCSSAEMLHWFCSPCIAHLHGCPLCRRAHPLCTAPPPRETQTDNLTLHTLRTLIARNVWAPPDTDGGDSPEVTWLDVLGEEDPAALPPHPPWRASTWTLRDGEEDPTIWVQDYEHYGGVPWGSLPPVGNLPDRWGPMGPMNRDNWRTTVLTLTPHLPFTFGWLVGDVEWAIGIARGAHGHEWGDFFLRSGGMTEGAPDRLMAAYLTWRGIPLPRRLVPVACRSHQPLVPTPQPGTYGNAVVARMEPWVPDTTVPSPPPGELRPSPPSPGRAPKLQPGLQVYALRHLRRPARHEAQGPPRPPAHPPPPPMRLPTHHSGGRPPKPKGLLALRQHQGPARHKAPGKNMQPNGRHNDSRRSTTRPQQPQKQQASPARGDNMPSNTNMATTSARPEQPLGIMRPQTGPGPRPAGDPGPQPETPPDASTHGHWSAAPT